MYNALETYFRVAKFKKISNSEIARRIGVTRADISQIKIKELAVSVPKFIKMAEAIGCDVILEDKETGLRYKL